MDYWRLFSDVTLRRKRMLINVLGSSFIDKVNSNDSVQCAEGQKNPETFPISEISIRLRDGTHWVLKDEELNSSLKMSRAQGIPKLLKKLREMQVVWHSPPNTAWDILIVTGSQDGLTKIFEAFVNAGDPIMAQTPVYFGLVGTIRPLSPDFLGIPQDADGMIPDEIEKICENRVKNDLPRPKLLYVNPTGANPTGTVLTVERKRRIYELAQKYDFLIVEDDPYYFLHFLNEQPPSLLSMDTDGRVIRLDSFSKIISAGLRVGVVTAHKYIISKLLIHVENSVLHSSSLSQMIIYKLFETWDNERFQQHFKEIQHFYKQKRDMMLAAAEKYLTGVAEWSVPKGGMFLWIKAKGVENAMDLTMEKLVPNGILVIPGNAFNYNSYSADQHFRLSYSFAKPEEIDKGLEIIGKTLREEMAKRR